MKAFSNADIFAIGRHRFGNDGKGVRTLIGFSGCPLRCQYCINPYTWNGTRKAKSYTPEMLFQELSVDNIYFQATGGGVTVGGGEPLLHPQFISDFIDIAPRSWDFGVETSLAVPLENIMLLVDKIDVFIVDIKSMDENIYRAYTGKNLNLAKGNLQSLLDLVGGERIIVRVPIIPEYADQHSQKQSADKLYRLGFSNLDLFTYRV